MDNAEEPYTIRIQEYNNNIIDEKVNALANDEEYAPEWFDVLTTLFKYMAPLVMSKYLRIINSPYIDTNAIQKVWIKNTARNVTTEISKIQMERISKNLDYIEKAVSKAEIDIKNYNNMAKSFPKLDRVTILADALKSGKLFTGKELSYRQLDQMSKSLNKYAENKATQEKWEIANQQAINDGFDHVKPYKIWLWSGLKDTRHSGMDETVIPINEHFIVFNEVNGDVDNLMFPHDINNDTNNCSNICNCGCDYDFLTQEEAEVYL